MTNVLHMKMHMQQKSAHARKKRTTQKAHWAKTSAIRLKTYRTNIYVALAQKAHITQSHNHITQSVNMLAKIAQKAHMAQRK